MVTPLDGSPGLFGKLKPYVEVAPAGTIAVNQQQHGLRVVCLSGATINLPPLADVGDGFELWVIGNLAAGVGDEVTITPRGGENINGGANLILTTANFEAVRVVKSTTQWVAGTA